MSTSRGEDERIHTPLAWPRIQVDIPVALALEPDAESRTLENSDDTTETIYLAHLTEGPLEYEVGNCTPVVDLRRLEQCHLGTLAVHLEERRATLSQHTT
eukprot:CAMPEP_0183368404 /NCGR_PEP_ID=MMETSP0164_2-20130417/95799_1 /TAXON_ID=221442 /ORGANISM="Coccolithus pelagicus ssp braarudi, Strain PLY182g" /LENGTH=99 /DNA_ID=CAMNT_0025544489 /DNA_START=217 /DNA_END=512 /DNA_ORIENTATION=+